MSTEAQATEKTEKKGIGYSDAISKVTSKMVGSKFNTYDRVDVEFKKAFGSNKAGDKKSIGKIKAEALKLKGIIK